jgi:hypothetical protein
MQCNGESFGCVTNEILFSARERKREMPTIALALIRFGVKQWKSSWCDGENDERERETEREMTNISALLDHIHC